MAFVKRHTQGYRSGLEDRIKAQLDSESVPFEYESFKIPYTKPESKYTPDFVLPNGIIIETKGLFTAEDRTKHLLVRAWHPDLDIRFVFSNSRSRLSKVSATTYEQWCMKHGFKQHNKTIPLEWIYDSVNPVSLAAIARLKQLTVKRGK